MKKKVAWGVVLGLLIHGPFPAEASRLGNPAAALKKNQTAVGAEYAFVTKDIETGSTKVETEIHRILGKLSYGIHDRIEGFGKVGVSTMDAAGNFDGDYGVAFGGGLKTTLLRHAFKEYIHVDVGAMGQFMHYETKDNIFVQGSAFDDEVVINEWDAACGVSYSYRNSSYYVAAYLNGLEGEEDIRAGLFGGTTTTSVDFEGVDLFGIAVGADFKLTQLKIGVEGRVGDQASVGVEFTYLF